MRASLLLLILSLAVMVQAKSELRLHMPYTIVSDTHVSDVPVGYCRVQGTVRSDDHPFYGGTISNLDFSRRVKTDSLGYYEMLIPETDSVIFFFGLYQAELVIQPYDFKSEHEVVIDFYTYYNHKVLEVDKPVVYLYSNQPLTASLKLDFNGELNFSYPDYGSGWKVDVSEEGIMAGGKNVPYLFWEGEMKAPELFTKDIPYGGTIVEKDELVMFLENQLTALGLNSREQTDFITFWVPQMMQSNYAFVHFIVDEMYAEKIAGISVDPKPDNMRRIYMVYTAFETKPELNCTPQHFEGFKRDGFTLVEWGGSEFSFGQIFQ